MKQTFLKLRRNKKGFTLAELLIVVAIIGVLVAIALPVFSSKLTEAQAAVDEANQRSARSMAINEYLIDKKTGTETYTFGTDDKGNFYEGGPNNQITITVENGKIVGAPTPTPSPTTT